MTLGIFGGTFNPIHLAHLRLAEECRESLGLERVLFIPSADPPHKTGGLASARDRLAMVELAITSNPAFSVLPLELERSGPSYTVDTLRDLARSYPGETLWFLMGSDSLAEIHSWRRPDEILEWANIAVVGRPGTSAASLMELLGTSLAPSFREGEGEGELTHRSGHKIRAVPFAPETICATELRQRIARGASLRYLVPEAVIEYIDKLRLYQADQEDP